MPQDMLKAFKPRLIKAKYFLQPQNYQNKMEGYCNRCPSFHIYEGGCRIVTYALKGTILDTDPLCLFVK